MTINWTIVIQLAFFFSVGVLGMLLHWAKRYARKQTLLGLVEYFKTNISYTILAVTTYVAMFVTLITSGIDYHSMQSMGTIFQTGYMIDSLLNKDEA